MVRIRPELFVLTVLFSGYASGASWDHYQLAVRNAAKASDTTILPAWQTPLRDPYPESIQSLPGGDVLLTSRGNKFEPAQVARFVTTDGRQSWGHDLGKEGVTASVVAADTVVAIVQSLFPDKIESRVLEIETGSLVWKLKVKAPGTLIPDVATNSLFAVEGRRVERYQLDTGKRLWQRRFGGKFTASPMSAGGRIFFVDEAGATLVLDGTSVGYRELARNRLNEPTFASPAVSQGRVFVRTAKHLFCVFPASAR